MQTPENVGCPCNCHEAASPDVQAECDCHEPENVEEHDA